MYGNSSGKLGRVGGGAGRGAKRLHSPFPPPPPPHRPIAPAARLSIGSAAARNRHPAPPAASVPAPTPREESFGLVSGGGDPLAFAMIIRLAPNLVDEIRRVEAEGGTARIKFDSIANNPSGNVIDVGGKDFRFSWSHEPGDLCDIYEERQSGVDGNGLLVEAGGAWRKLNVQRILDESTKNHVKMRSEEAERKLKSRKAIVLDHGNPSVKNQMKTLSAAAVESVNTRRMPFRPKHEPAFKKQKVEAVQATSGTGPKSSFKMGFPTTTSKGRLSVSPVPSPPEQLGPSASPIGTVNSTRNQTEEIILPRVTKKDETSFIQKEMPARAVEATATLGKKRGSRSSSMDLQSMLIALLLENPKGMSLKALEKAIGDSIPNCAKKIEPIIKKIANFQAPGRYILRSGVDLESIKKQPSESGSSPENARDQTSVLGKTVMDEDEQHSPLNPKLEESNQLEKNGVQQDSPDPLFDRKASDHSDGHAGSSSDTSDSDSDSDSGSDSGSGSGSQSKSPVGSGSGSSSDSESDGSSSNKEEGSDIDVDIISDDEKEGAKHKLLNLNPEPGLATSHSPWQNDGQLEQNGFDEDQIDVHVTVGDKTAKEIHEDNDDAHMIDITNSAPNNATLRMSPDPFPSSLDYNHIGDRKQLPSAGNSVDERLDKWNGSRLGPSDSSGGLVKLNSTNSYDQRGLPQISESAKRMKPGRPTEQPSFLKSKEAIFSESPPHSSKDLPGQDLQGDHNLRMIDRVSKGPLDSSLQRGHGFDILGKPVMDGHHSSQMIGDLVGRGSASDVVDKTRKYVENSSRNAKISEKNSTSMEENGSTLRSTHGREKFSTNKDKVTKEMQDDDGSMYEKSLTNNARQLDVGDKLSTPLKSQYKKQGEQVGRLKDTADQMANSIMRTNVEEDDRTDVHRSPMANDKVLRRELSELELGELREPIQSEGGSGSKKKFDKRNSFKLSENKAIPSVSLNAELSKGRHAGKGVQDSRKKISPDSFGKIPINLEDSLKKRIIEDGGEESSLPQQRIPLSQSQQLLKLGHGDSGVGAPLTKSAELGSRLRNSEGQRHQVGHEGYPSTHKKAPVSADINCIKEGKTQKPNTAIEMNGRKKDLNGGPKRRASFSDDDISYSKFEKDEPELKGPILDIKQYKEYVQEYREKYDSYCSINKSLETYRNDFSKLGHDLKLAKDGDSERYLNILDQLKESYHKCGERHKRLKKIFIVLHEELQLLKQRIKEFAVTYERD